MRRVLIVAYYFPPIGGIGSIRLARFAQHLHEFGWEAFVLAPRDTPHHSDEQLRYPEDHVVRSRSIELSRLGKALRRRSPTSGTASKEDNADGVRKQGLRLVFPDAQIGWYPGAVLTGLGLLRRQRFDAVFSSSYPMTAHLVARTLTRRVRGPWVAEFRDPWSDSLPVNSPHRRRAAHLERALARRATALVMPSPTWATHFGGVWGREVSVIPNGFDAQPNSASPPARPTLTYLGTYYPGRQNLAPLWDAVARIRRDPVRPPPRIRFIGDLPTEGREELSAAGLGDLVEETGIIPHEQAMQLFTRSSLLIASGESRANVIARGWIPAKLFEYLATSLPILYLGDPAGDAATMLARYPGCRVIAPDDRDGLDGALQTELAGARYERDVSGLSRRVRAQTLAGVLDAAAFRSRSARST
jgi:glycosyltransferase involved in cell wall biosynthesis